MSEGTTTITAGRAIAARAAEGPETLSPAYVRHLCTRSPRDLLQLERDDTRPREPRRFRSGVEKPVWLEMELQVNVDNHEWFEGSLDPWVDVDRPRVYWDEVALRVRRLLNLDPPHPEDLEPADPKVRALALLPHLYALGVNRAVQELRLPPPDAPSIRLFPVIGFGPPVRDADGHLELHMIRMNVAVIDDVIFSIRLPDQPCPDRRERDERGRLVYLPRAQRRVHDPLLLPSRFLPRWREARAVEVAEEIARHQAATARALADEVRTEMSALDEREEESTEESDPGAGRPTLRSSFLLATRGEDAPDPLTGWPLKLLRVFVGAIVAAAVRLGRALRGAARAAWRVVKGAIRRPPERRPLARRRRVRAWAG